jgi:hypothetical protein
MRFLREALKNNNIQIYPIVLDLAQQDHQEELESGVFEYTDKSNRFWHPLQRYRKSYRTQILADSGYDSDYDIECAAPTLIHQYAQRCGMDLYLFALRGYLRDKNTYRQQLAQNIHLPIAAIKEIITALFAGAVISKNIDSDIYHILNGDLARIEYLKQDPFISELKSDIKICWEYIAPYMSRRRNTQTNRLLPITAKQKWNVYFELERVVMNSVRIYLNEREIKYFLIHDGWTCDREIDRDDLRDHVRIDTGYEVRFDYKKTHDTAKQNIITRMNLEDLI